METNSRHSGDKLETSWTQEASWRQGGNILQTNWMHPGDKLDTPLIPLKEKWGWRHAGDTLETSGRQTGYIPKTGWIKPGEKQETPWKHTGESLDTRSILETSWKHLGNKLEIIWIQAGGVLKTIDKETGPGTSWKQTVDIMGTQWKHQRNKLETERLPT